MSDDSDDSDGIAESGESDEEFENENMKVDKYEVLFDEKMLADACILPTDSPEIVNIKKEMYVVWNIEHDIDDSKFKKLGKDGKISGT